MSRASRRRVGSPTVIEMSPEARAVWAQAKWAEEEEWTERSGEVRTRTASPEELAAIRAGVWRPSQGAEENGGTPDER